MDTKFPKSVLKMDLVFSWFHLPNVIHEPGLRLYVHCLQDCYIFIKSLTIWSIPETIRDATVAIQTACSNNSSLIFSQFVTAETLTIDRTPDASHYARNY